MIPLKFRATGAAVTLLLCAFSAEAGTWTRSYTVQYNLGETDSRSTARKNAMDEIRARALREVGAYIETRTTLKNDDLQEETKVITASMVKIVETGEHFSLLKDGHEQLSVTARVTVDESELKARILAAQHDRAEKQVLQDQLTAQERENAVLEAQLGRSKGSSMNIPPPPPGWWTGGSPQKSNGPPPPPSP
ncbi:hypothetical protein [Ferrovum sp.]|uniref:hypothetical protein n=1 Tax=Ferrovum sp. TaxID=2609467 RepID=UPI0026073664|nr:hypothetical protein [Ferrovum sp.]